MTAVAERPAKAMPERASRQIRAADRMTFAALLTAVGCARLFVKYTLQNWRVEREHIETAELLSSELVTNAVKSTGIIEPHPAYTALNHLALVHVRLLLFDNSVVLEAWDADPNPPVMQEQTLDAEGGRGLLLVATMSRRWNYYHPKSGGKVVWCEIALPSWPTEGDTAELPRVLPRRKRHTGPTQPTQVMNDPELLRRVIEGLHALDSGDDEPKGD
jgi:anti-sigma regulatory factor (Ser/Thr protein kinase)